MEDAKLSCAQYQAPLNIITLVFIFSSVVMAANIVGQKPVVVFGLIISSGSAIFPLTFLITAIITEVYGRKMANYIIFIGLITNLLIAGFINLSICLPPPSFWQHQDAYELVMTNSIYIYIMSSVAYVASEFTNVWTFSYLAKQCKGKCFLFRLLFSTAIALIIDTLALVPIMLKSSPTTGILVKKFVSLVVFKLLFILCGAPFAGIIKRKLKKSEEEGASFSKQIFSSKSPEQSQFNNVTYILQAKRS